MLVNMDLEGNILGFAYFVEDACLIKRLDGDGYDITLPIRIDYMSNLYYLINNTLIVDVSGAIEYNDSYYSYKAGKPSRIGSSSIEYNDSYYSYKAGKIRSI